MLYKGTLIAVKDVEVSKKFYEDLFDQKVLLDLGWNKCLSGGFSIQQGYASLVGFDENTVIQKPHNMELYFEVNDFEGFMKKLEDYGDIKYVHSPKQYDWKQRVVRIYDPDDHIIEIGESMIHIIKRYLNNGYSVDDTAKEVMHPVEFVQAVAEGKINE